MRRFLVLLFPILLMSDDLMAQMKISKDQGLKYFINEAESNYIQFSGSIQPWLRYLDNNPGTLINDEPQAAVTDISLRRLRVSAEMVFNQKLKFLVIMGGNNFNPTATLNEKFRILNLTASYNFSSEFKLGIGKTQYGKFSRYGAPASTRIMSLDIPLQALPTVNALDDLGRNWSIYATGLVKNVKYQVALSYPVWSIQENNISDSPVEQYSFAADNEKYKISGYVKIQLIDIENRDIASSPGTYFGKGQFLNIGLGFSHQPEGMWRAVSPAETEYHNINMAAADMFLEIPLRENNGPVITSYIAGYFYDFGEDFIRNMGINNPASGSNDPSIFNGPGNRYPLVGTGKNWYAQFGYLFGKKQENQSLKNRVQLYVLASGSHFKSLEDPSVVYEGGINYYINGQNSKLTAGFQSRPVFTYESSDVINVTDRKGWVVLQYQLSIR